MASIGFVLVSLQLWTYSTVSSIVFIADFQQVNVGYVQNMYVSSRMKNHILATTKTRKAATLYELEHQNNVEGVLVLCCLSFNFEFLLFASISFATLSMYFVDWSNFANIKTIVLAFIRHSRE